MVHASPLPFRIFSANEIMPPGGESGRESQHRDEMTRGARDDEQVPDEVAETDPLGRIEHHTHRICDTTCQQPEQTLRWHAEPQRLYRDQDEPAHGEIQGRSEFRIPYPSCHRKYDAAKGQTPHDPE